MAVPIHLPKVGMTMEDGELVRWLVADGARVEPGEAVFEMETEKVEIEVESDEGGVLKQLVEEGTKLKPGAIVGCLLDDAESDVPPEMLAQVGAQWSEGSSSPSPAAASPSAIRERTPARAPTGGRILATPIARRLAAEHDIDLADVTGSGRNGRITEADVRQRIDATGDSPAGEMVPYGGRRRTIGQRMHESLQSMAQVTLTSETGVDEATRLLHRLNREWRGERVVATLTALVMRASALALREHPRLNSRLDGDRIVIEPEVNVGFAVDLDDGLMVPVVRAVDTLSLQDVARAIADLNERTRENRLSVDDVTGGTFTVSSLEGTDIDAFTPVINPPQAAVLGVGRVRDIPVFEESGVARGRATTLSLTFDHRVVDGAPAARFLHSVRALLAEPEALL